MLPIMFLQVFFSESNVSFAECSCPIGEFGQCHHIAAVLHYASTNISPTDTECKWSFKIKAGHGNEGLPIDSFYPSSKPDYQAIPGPLSSAEIAEARNRLAKCKGAAAAIKWYTDPEPPEDGEAHSGDAENIIAPQFRVPSIEEVVKTVGLYTCDDKVQFFKHNFNLSWTDIVSIAEATQDQSACPLWVSSPQDNS